MYPLLAASFGIILRKFPSRTFLKQTSLNAALGVFAATLVITAIEEILAPDPLSGNTVLSVGGALVLSILSFLVILVIGQWIINRYVTERFSYKEMFVLEMLLTGATQIVFALVMIVASFLGAAVMAGVGFVGLVFGIYMLLTFQSAVSNIASITKSQAANVIVGPILILLVVWFGFIALAGGFGVAAY